MTTEGTNIADILPEPENGTRLVVTEYDGNQRIIWRDDAAVISRYPTERWLHDLNDDPMEWRAILKYATAVYSIPDKPLATLPPVSPRPKAVRGVRRPTQIVVTQDIDTVAPGSSVTGLRIDNL